MAVRHPLSTWSKQTALTQALVIDKPLEIREHNKHASLVPADEFSVDMSIEFNDPVIGKQSMNIKVNEEVFSQQLAPARTFGFQEQLDTLHKLDLAKGGALNNAVLIRNNKVVNEEGLRFKDEFVLAPASSVNLSAGAAVTILTTSCCAR
jgi:UDP-3-O-[3-hydroxymyristoyl] N-acetylglucosamine deacetylase